MQKAHIKKKMKECAKESKTYATDQGSSNGAMEKIEEKEFSVAWTVGNRRKEKEWSE